MAEVPIHTEQRNRGGRGRPRLDGLRACYSIPMLALLAGMTRWQMERWLLSVGEHLIKQPGGPGTLRQVYVHELRRASPEMWNSLLDLEAARLNRARLGQQHPRRRITDVEPPEPDLP
jgi:hypothetical protein